MVFAQGGASIKRCRRRNRLLTAASHTWWILIYRNSLIAFHHDRQIARMGQSITDKRILRLVGIMLRCGVMVNGVVNPSKEGAMQGGPLSPLLSNIVLDELDQELEKTRPGILQVCG